MASVKFNALAGLRKLEAEEDEDELTMENAGDEKPTLPSASDDPNKFEAGGMEKNGVVLGSEDTVETTNDATSNEGMLSTAAVADSSENKPLKSILKRRAVPDSLPTTEVSSNDEKPDLDDLPPGKPNFGGSITEALKKITEVSTKEPKLTKNEKESNEPVPSAFIQEMQKQKDLLPAPGACRFPSREPVFEGIEMMWGDAHEGPEPDSFFLREQKRMEERKFKRQKKPPNEKKRVLSLKEAKAKEEAVESIVRIGNLPFKVTNQSLILVLGVWPKDGYDGVRIIYDRAGMPAGHAFVILERHADMMTVIRMTGLEMEGRKIRVTVSDRETLKKDWRETKEALLKTQLSRVIRVGQLPFHLQKSELVKTMKEVSFKEDDIYWKPLKSNQQNSGRGYVVLSSSADVKKLLAEKYTSCGRRIEVRQVHPVEMVRFCEQCKIKPPADLLLNDPLPDNIDEIADGDIPLPAVEDKPKPKPSPRISPERSRYDDDKSNFVVMDDLENVTIKPRSPGEEARREERRRERERSPPRHERERPATIMAPPPARKRRKRRRKRKRRSANTVAVDMEIEAQSEDTDGDSAESSDGSESTEGVARPPSREQQEAMERQRHAAIDMSRPPFPPTVFVRMYNVPDKASTKDIRNFFAPLLPAKIAHNIGYDIYDIQFYNPDDAWQAMRKHFLLIRKNVITLEMLPGPPTPLPPCPEVFRPPTPKQGKKRKKGDKAKHHMEGQMPMMHRPGEPMPPGIIPPGMVPVFPDGSRPMHPDVGPSPMVRIGLGPVFMHVGPRPILVGGPGSMHPDMGPRPIMADMGPEPMHQDMGPRPMHPDMGPRPVMIEMGPRPMHPGMAPRLMNPDMGPRPMHLDMGQRPMHPDMGQRPMHPDVGPRPMHHDMGPRPMHPEMGPGAVHPDVGLRPMHPDMGPHPMHPDMGLRPMHPDVGLRPMHFDMGPQPMHPDMGPRPVHPDMGPRPMHPEFGARFMHLEMGPRPFPLEMGPRPFMMPNMGPQPDIGPRPFPPGMRPMNPVGIQPMRPEIGMRPMYPMMGPHPTESPENLAPERPGPTPRTHHEGSKSGRPTAAIDPNSMPPPMHAKGAVSARGKTGKKPDSKEREAEPQKELIPVPPLPQDFTTYRVPPYKSDTPVGQATITPMQGYFCQLCNKFYSSRKSAKVTHCKSKGHYDKLKQFLQEKKRIRKLAENSV